MSSRSSGVALELGSQPSCSTPLPLQRNSFPALHLLPPRSRSFPLLSQEDFFESFSGSFCEVSDVLGADLLDCNCSIPDPQLVRRIVSQVEFYLSDENLAKDAFLLKHVQKNKMGFVSIKLLTSFKKVKYLTRDWRLTLYALQFSELLEVNKEGTKVRRRVPVPESLLSIPPSKLLLAWELLPQEQDVLLPLQKNFLETITRMFSPFGAITSIRILRPGRKLPSDVRKYTSRFPELLSKCCALVEYESLESARRAFEDLGRQSRPGGESIKVVRLCGKGSKKKPGAEREVMEELVDTPGWKAQAAAATFSYGIGDSLLCSSLESDHALASPPLLLHKDPLAPTWPGGDFKPSDFSSSFTGSLLTSKVFPPLGTGLGTGSCSSFCSSTESPRGCGWGSGAGAWTPWRSSPSLDAKPPPGNPPAAKRVPELLSLRDGVLRLPHGPNGTKGFCSSFGRGELVLRR
ncbi:la-related protein 6-like [Gymnogyps californianus]|uniref:la-related protein 6-like n=1 Tax=Gymnogyps californianus TaxID=33616 RepID=UPI0021C7F9EB|nr:la-related protein 6-like [Gymnogyps californianus]